MRGHPLRFLALGDSYTIGEGVAPDERWPARLAASLRDAGIPIGDPEIIARTGWTTDELDAAITVAEPRGAYALVTLLIGVNDQYRGRSVSDYRPRFAALLERAIGFAGGQPRRVIVLSIPDWSVTPFAAGRDRAAIAGEIDAYNEANRSEAGRRGAAYVDVAPESRQAGEVASLLAGDGLHPSGTMYDAWTRLVLPAARHALGREG